MVTTYKSLVTIASPLAAAVSCVRPPFIQADCGAITQQRNEPPHVAAVGADEGVCPSHHFNVSDEFMCECTAIIQALLVPSLLPMPRAQLCGCLLPGTPKHQCIRMNKSQFGAEFLCGINVISANSNCRARQYK